MRSALRSALCLLLAAACSAAGPQGKTPSATPSLPTPPAGPGGEPLTNGATSEVTGSGQGVHAFAGVARDVFTDERLGVSNAAPTACTARAR